MLARIGGLWVFPFDLLTIKQQTSDSRVAGFTNRAKHRGCRCCLEHAVQARWDA